MTALGTEARPLRVAVVGSGPAGFYATEALFKSDHAVQVDMIDRLPTPFGLVRGGVAPDHQKIKNVIKVYERIASHDAFRFLGNVMLGRDVSVEELRRFYDAIIVACGAETDRKLNIPGEDLPGSYTATEFVGWYNGHPDYRDREFDLSAETAVVIGQGNVAMDVSRILAKTVDELKETDIADYALDALAASRVRRIVVVGRRGAAQAKFTPPEIKEIGELADCDPFVQAADMELSAVDQEELEHADAKHNRKNVEVLRSFVDRTRSASKVYELMFYKSPVELRGAGRVEQVVLERNVMKGEASGQWAEGTGETEVLDCGLFFRSVGYRGIPLPSLPFDEKRGVIPNRDGRVTDGDTVLPGVYVAGWIKRGPSGVIGTNKPDSVETVARVLEDLPSLAPCEQPEPGAAETMLRERGVRVVSFDDWKLLDLAEIARGKEKGKPREKFATIDEMLAALGD